MDNRNVQKACWCWLVFQIIIETLDLICDWLFFVDVNIIERGLVFGPHPKSVVTAVLVFCIFSTLDSPFQIFVTIKDTPHKDKDEELETICKWITLVILFVEDIPQAVILLIISLCREDPSSIWATAKASFMIFTCCIKLVGNCVTCRNKKCSILNNIIFGGNLIELALTITVFLATQTQRLENGQLRYESRKTLIDEKFNENFYFSNVSIFIHNPNFLPPKVNDFAPAARPKFIDTYWLHLDHITNVQKHEYLSFKLEYDTSKEAVTILKISKHKGQPCDPRWWKVTACYRLRDRRTGNIVDPKQCSMSPDKTLYLTFKYIHPHPIFKKYIMGDITFNATWMPETLNLNNISFTENIHSDANWQRKDKTQIETTSPIILHYFKQSKHGDSHLTDVKEIWKTGWSQCDTSGNLGPRFDNKIKLLCNN